MVIVFFIYWAWYLMMMYLRTFVDLSPFESTLVAVSLVLNIAFGFFAPKFRDAFVFKHTNQDYNFEQYLNACLGSRILLMALACFGLTNIMWNILGAASAIGFYYAVKGLNKFINRKRFTLVIGQKHADIE